MFDLVELLSREALTAFFQVIVIDLVLVVDNAVVIGLAAAGLLKTQRARAILGQSA
jgi:predicted tellurium resistance membrane protein TerC